MWCHIMCMCVIGKKKKKSDIKQSGNVRFWCQSSLRIKQQGLLSRAAVLFQPSIIIRGEIHHRRVREINFSTHRAPVDQKTVQQRDVLVFWVREATRAFCTQEKLRVHHLYLSLHLQQQHAHPSGECDKLTPPLCHLSEGGKSLMTLKLPWQVEGK